MSTQLNLEEIREKIKQSCEKISRKVEDIQLIAVSKTVEISLMEEAVKCGVQIFGESKVQEFLPKYEHFKEAVSWHFIGHLQKNKVKYIIDKVDLIHSVDDVSLAKEISKQAEKHNKLQEILLQVNIVNEESKYGFSVSELMTHLEEISLLPNIKIKGLMLIPPYEDDIEKSRTYFQQFEKIFVDIKNKNNDNIDMDYLSMGMTNDYMIAIEEGANMIRIGTGIFGKRHYQ